MKECVRGRVLLVQEPWLQQADSFMSTEAGAEGAPPARPREAGPGDEELSSAGVTEPQVPPGL